MRVELVKFFGPTSGASRRVVGYATFALPEYGIVLIDLKVTRGTDSGVVYVEPPSAPVVANGVSLRDAGGGWVTRKVVQFINPTDEYALSVAARVELFAHHPELFDHIPPNGYVASAAREVAHA